MLFLIDIAVSIYKLILIFVEIYFLTIYYPHFILLLFHNCGKTFKSYFLFDFIYLYDVLIVWIIQFIFLFFPLIFLFSTIEIIFHNLSPLLFCGNCGKLFKIPLLPTLSVFINCG